MTKYFSLSLAAVLLFAGAAFAQSNNESRKCRDLNQKAAKLAVQYRELRDRRSRLPEGVFDKDLKGYGGKLHEVLSALGRELGHAAYTRRDVVQCLGEPDAVKNGGEMGGFLGIYNRERRKKGEQPVAAEDGRAYLIYFWRGWHDFLFFIIEDGRILDHGWWFAYE